MEQFLKVDPTEDGLWREIMERNIPGEAPAGAPIFISQGTADTTVRPDITKKFAAALCRQGERVRFVSLNGVGHIFAAKYSVGEALAWMGERFRGVPAPSKWLAPPDRAIPRGQWLILMTVFPDP